jgi:hypothetical protein
MPYEAYKIIHLVGLMLLFLGFGALLYTFALKVEVPKKLRSLAFALHGTGLLFLFVSGFGLLARLNLPGGGIPNWTFAKIAIWLIMGAQIVLIKKRASSTLPVIIVLITFGGLAAFLAITKPF